MTIELYGYTATGNRVENEDSYTFEKLSDSAAYAIVCDGLGGHGGGKAASGAAVAAISQCRSCEGLPGAEDVMRWMEQANREILEKRDNANHMKTTAVMLFLSGGKAMWAHIGDTRMYHFLNGETADVTLDHSLGQLAVKTGEINRRDIPDFPGRSTLTRAIGDDTIKPEIHPAVELAGGHHAFLLCSDGLWERLHEDEILLELHKASTPEQWIFALRCRAQMRKWDDVDNNTAVAVFVKG